MLAMSRSSSLSSHKRSRCATLAAAIEAIEHPMPTVLTRMSCYELQDRWEACSQTWRDCVELVGVSRHLLPIPARFLLLDGQPLVASAAKRGKRGGTARS